MKKRLVALVTLLVIASIISGCSNYKFKPSTAYEIEDFEMTDHRGEKVTLDSLKGKPWIAMFIFTNCTTICSPMTVNMAKIQEGLIERGVEDYNIVAFSVDPKNDTPEALTEYLDFFGVPDESKWHLLTGYDQKFIEQFAKESFKTLVKAPTNSDSDQVTHMNTFHLVDETGIIVKNYSGYSETEDGVSIDTIAIDMQTLIEERLGK